MANSVRPTRRSFAHFLLVSLGTFYAAAQTLNAVPVTNCNGTGTLLGVRISNCTTLPCLLKRGSRTTVELDFIPSASASSVTTGASAKIGPVKVSFVGVNGSPACSKIISKESRENVGCKLNNKEAYTYSNTFDIKDYYPTAKILVQWELIDSSVKSQQQKMVCFQVPAKIV